MKKVLATLFLTALLGSTVAVSGASAYTPKPPLKCTLAGCPHND
jgi:hypothetical protein